MTTNVRNRVRENLTAFSLIVSLVYGAVVTTLYKQLWDEIGHVKEDVAKLPPSYLLKKTEKNEHDISKVLNLMIDHINKHREGCK